MPVHTTVTVSSQSAWTPLNAGQAATGNVSIYNKGGTDVDVLVSTSTTAPALDATTLGQSFLLKPGDAILGQTLAALAPGLASPSYLYARAPYGPGLLMVSCA